MELSYYSGCTNSNIKIKDENLDVFLSYYDDEDLAWQTHLPLLKTILTQLINEIKVKDEDKLKTLYRHFVEHDFNEIDYKSPVSESIDTVITRLTTHLTSLTLESKFEIMELCENIFAIICEFQGNTNKHSSFCGQCNDYNHGYTVQFNKE